MDTIKHTVLFNIPAKTLFEAWLDSKEHGKMINGNAKINPIVDGKFSIWDDYATGVTLEIDPKNYKIVQSWCDNSSDWPEDHMSIITLQIKSIGEKSCELFFEHAGVPKKNQKDIEQGWKDYYWHPMANYFKAKKS
ncbi:MAG: SRPBCC domain-containing protein [Patescibacteria group bacterium]